MFYEFTLFILILLRQCCYHSGSRLVVHPEHILWYYPQTANVVH